MRLQAEPARAKLPLFVSQEELAAFSTESLDLSRGRQPKICGFEVIELHQV
jgi:hypothetical protein